MIRHSDALRLETMTGPDMTSVMTIEAQCFKHAHWENPDNFFNRPGRNPYVVRNKDDKIVGFLLLEGERGDNVFTIIKMARHPDRRGKGIGPFILGRCRKIATEMGAKRLFLRVRKSNTDAIGLYTREGFKAKKTRTGYYRNGSNATDKTAVEMELSLV